MTWAANTIPDAIDARDLGLAHMRTRDRRS